MHNAAFRALEMDWTYELLDVEPHELADAVRRLRHPDVGGANVTIPYKQAVMDQLDGVDAEAVRARAVNTITRAGEKLEGSNTDISGIREAIDAAAIEVRGARAVVLGAGGAARAAAVALDGAHLTFATRHPETADLPGHVIAWDDPNLAGLSREAEILVNATPLGRQDEMPLRPNALPKAGAVIDLVYVSGGTPLARKARSLGLRVVDGWEVLLRQGVRSFEKWTGSGAPIEVMRQTLAP